MPSGLFYLNSLERSISYVRSVWLVLLLLVLLCSVEISELNANSVNPDQTPRSVASDLGIHCFLMCLLWDARLKWVTWYTTVSALLWLIYREPTVVAFLTGRQLVIKKGKRKVQGVPQSQTAALPRPQEEEETDKCKQAQTKQTYEKH